MEIAARIDGMYILVCSLLAKSIGEKWICAQISSIMCDCGG